MALGSVLRRVLPAPVARVLRRVRRAATASGAPPSRAGGGGGQSTASAHLEAAEAATERRDWDEAAACWQAVLDELGDRANPRAYVRLGQARQQQGALEEAVAVVWRGLERFEGHPRLIQLRAELATAERDWAEAARRWQEVLDLRGEEATSGVYVHLSRALRQLRRVPEAVEVIRRAGDRHPDSPKVVQERAELLHLRACWDESIEEWERVLELNQQRGPVLAFVRMSEAHRQLGRWEAAEQIVRRGRAARPASPRVAREAAEVSVARRDWHEAARRWEDVLELAGEAPSAKWIYRYGVVLERLERWPEALRAYEQALTRLEEVDLPWANEAALTWRFRRDLARQHVAPEPDVDPRLTCRVAATGRLDPAEEPVGWVLAEVTHKGVRFFGGLDVDATSVEVLVDDEPVKTVGVDTESATRPFALHVKHEALATFPADCEVTIRTARGRLAAEDTKGRADAFALRVPYGDGTLFERLDRGVVLTKKGTLFDLAAFEGEGARQQVEAYAVLREVFTRRLGRELFLLYGTLLGYHRDGRFITGDDDLDVGYLTDATDPAAAKADAMETALELLRAGHDVTTRFGGGLLKVFIEGVELDVYPVWFFDGRAWAYDAVPASPEHFLPVRTGAFHGVEVAVPSDPEVLLEGTYGPGWRTPDPGFRHVRRPEVMVVLEQTYLLPSDARRLAEINEQDRRRDPQVGRFTVTLDPGPPSQLPSGPTTRSA